MLESSSPATSEADTLESARLSLPVLLLSWLARLLGFVVQVGLGAIVGAAFTHEIITSAWQAQWFSRYAARVQYGLGEGASREIGFPGNGPFDLIRGYSRLPAFQIALASSGYGIVQQARQSPALQSLLRHGIAPPYRESASAGLILRGPDGTLLFDAAHTSDHFERFDDIPPLVVEALLYIENRELLAPFDPRSNPAIEWDRMARATFLYGAGKLGLSAGIQGGSTLAVQLEKYRHSPRGRTHGAGEKLRQILAASLKAYQDGEDTLAARREIIVDYLNTLPLAAVPGYGEVYGLGAGLRTWFGADLASVRAALSAPNTTLAKVRGFKQVMTLLAAVRAPTGYLIEDRQALEQRVNSYTDLLARNGKLEPRLAQAVLAMPADFAAYAPNVEPRPFIERKGLSALRSHLMKTLRVPNVYDLHRLDLVVDSTIDPALQQGVTQMFLDLGKPEFVKAHQLSGEHLLRSGDPANVIYSLLLFEKTAAGNLARVQTDNLERPFDINDGIKMELGSTAKARTLAHYLELLGELHVELSALSREERQKRLKADADPITRWAIETLERQPGLALEPFLQASLDRTYSASPDEAFFTGGGLHRFGNFDRTDNGRVYSLREALKKSTNLVFIRLMRDLVRFHQTRLPYDVADVMENPESPVRRQMLREIADAEGIRQLHRAYKRYAGAAPAEMAARLLGKRQNSERHLAILFFAWKIGNDEAALAEWLEPRVGTVPPATVRKLFKAYQNPRLDLSDYGYLLSRHPLDLWVASEVRAQPDIAWEELVARGAEARQNVSRWLFKPRNRRAQDLRLRIRVEQDAFARMTPYWQRLGFPFDRLVPSLATSIGNSSDRPVALADFMGILVNDGVRRPLLRMNRLHFAADTPYETVFEPAGDSGQRVMRREVARVLKSALAQVVEAGTARRLHGVFKHSDGTPAVVGGKTGSGDNRFKTFSRGGGVTSARAVNRTATFIFFIDDRYFGVVTAYVPGKEAAQYEFTSALPVSLLKLAAPGINATL